MRVPELLLLPEQVVSDAELRSLGAWILANAQLEEVPHIHDTHRDERPQSQLRKVEIPINMPGTGDRASDEATGTARKMYNVIRGSAEAYWDMPLRDLPTRHAAVAHAYLPGDGPGEGHVDLFPTVPCYVTSPSNSGFLHVARMRGVDSIDQTMTGTYRLEPTPGTYALLLGTEYAHQTEGLPENAGEARTSVNMSYLPPDEMLWELDRTHPRFQALLADIAMSGEQMGGLLDELAYDFAASRA